MLLLSFHHSDLTWNPNHNEDIVFLMFTKCIFWDLGRGKSGGRIRCGFGPDPALDLTSPNLTVQKKRYRNID
jgi:hypothetical protein